jgi:hypothetical protein
MISWRHRSSRKRSPIRHPTRQPLTLLKSLQNPSRRTPKRLFLNKNRNPQLSDLNRFRCQKWWFQNLSARPLSTRFHRRRLKPKSRLTTWQRNRQRNPLNRCRKTRSPRSPGLRQIRRHRLRSKLRNRHQSRCRRRSRYPNQFRHRCCRRSLNRNRRDRNQRQRWCRHRLPWSRRHLTPPQHPITKNRQPFPLTRRSRRSHLRQSQPRQKKLRRNCGCYAVA